MLNADGTPLRKTDKEFYSKISQLRKVKSGGKYFKDTKAAREAQKKAVESRLRASKLRTQEEKIQEDTLTA